MLNVLIIVATCGIAAAFLLFVDSEKRSLLVLPLYYLSFSILTVLYADIDNTPGWKPYRILYVLLVVLSVLHMVSKPEWSSVSLKRVLWIPYVAIIVDFFFSAVYAPRDAWNIVDSGHGLEGYIVVVGLYWIAATQFRRESDFRYFIWTTVLCGLVISAWVIQNAWRVGFSEARAGLEVNQIYVVEFIAIGVIPLIDFSFVPGWGFKKKATLLAVFISIYGVYLTGARGAMLGIAAATAAIAWRHAKKNGPNKTVRSLVGIAIVCGMVFLLPGDENVLQRLLNNSAPSQGVEARYIIWPFLLFQLSSRTLLHWFIGDGMNSSLVVLRSTFDIGWGDPHNMYLQTLYDQGLIGLALFLGFLYSIKKRLMQSTELVHLSLYYGWFSYLIVAGLFEVEANGKPFWILLGLIAANCAIATEAVHLGGSKLAADRNLSSSKPAQDGAKP
jgi:O-antigen ligase